MFDSAVYSYKVRTRGQPTDQILVLLSSSCIAPLRYITSQTLRCSIGSTVVQAVFGKDWIQNSYRSWLFQADTQPVRCHCRLPLWRRHISEIHLAIVDSIGHKDQSTDTGQDPELKVETIQTSATTFQMQSSTSMSTETKQRKSNFLHYVTYLPKKTALPAQWCPRYKPFFKDSTQSWKADQHWRNS